MTNEASSRYAEEYPSESQGTRVARQASADLGIAPVSPATAATLTLLTQLAHAQAIVEIGTGTGVAALAFFQGMDSDGILTSIDIEPEHQMAAREALKLAGIPHTRYRLIAGEALTVLPKLSSSAYDIAFVDAAFVEYPEYLEECLRIVKPGGLVILHHALLGGKVADAANFDDDTMLVRDALDATRTLEGFTTALIPVGDGLLVALTPA